MRTNKKIFIIGSGGHAKTCIDVIETLNKFKISSLIDKNISAKRFLTYKIIKESDFEKFSKEKANILIGIGQIKNSKLRENKFIKYKRLGYNFPNIISKFAYVSRHAFLKEGNLVCHGAVINASVVVGSNCIINNQSLLEHDTIIGNHCHISTGALINGGVFIGSNTFIGSGTVVKEGIKIGKNCIVGAGLTIKKNLKSFSTVK